MRIALYDFLKYLVANYSVITDLIWNDFRAAYLSSHLGIAWAVIQPVCMILVLWFVFGVGLRAGGSGDDPFVLWMACGLVPWFFIAEALNSGAGSIVGKSFMVKRVAFRVGVIPLITIGVSFIIHLLVLLVLFVFLLSYGYMPTLFWLQIPYYFFSAVVLLLGVSWLASALMVFVKDIKYLVSVLVQFGFWLTPIVWPIDSLAPKYQALIRLSPVNYIIEGYRNSLLDGVWFWQDIKSLLSFWLVTALVVGVGVVVFRRLRPHFADVI